MPARGGLGDLVLILDYGGAIIDANEAYCAATGLDAAAVVGSMLASHVHPQARARMVIVRGTFAHGAHEAEAPLALADGTYRWCRWTLTPAAGIAGGLRVVGYDIDSDLRSMDHPASASEGVLALSFAQSPTGMVITEIDADHDRERVIRVNRAAAELLGYTEEELLADGERLLRIASSRSPAVGKRVVRHGPEFVEVERPLERRDGTEVWVAMHADTVRDHGGRPLNRFVRFHDITDQHEEEAALRYLADHDPLTGLANRRRFREEVRRAVGSADRFGDAAAVLFIDLDGFKYLNDTHGHAVGDTCLVRIAGILRQAVRDIDVVGRFGGDEFAILLVRTKRDDAVRIADEIRAAVRDAEIPVPDGSSVALTISVGVAMVEPEADLSAADLMIAADVAMYDAKRAGRDIVSVYSRDPDTAQRAEARLVWATRIRDALNGDGFVLVAQPVVDARDEQVAGYALRLRLPSDDGFLLRPGRFLYAAARVGLAERVDLWVVARALDYLARLSEPALFLEVRISSHLIANRDAASRLLAEIHARATDPQRLVLVIDDRALTDARAAVDLFVAEARTARCRIGIDRFGSGYAAFSHLRETQLDVMRLDGRIAAGVATDETDRLFVETMVRLAHGLGATVLAPHVADQSLIPILAGLGCDYLQGLAVGTVERADEILPLA